MSVFMSFSCLLRYVSVKIMRSLTLKVYCFFLSGNEQGGDNDKVPNRDVSN